MFKLLSCFVLLLISSASYADILFSNAMNSISLAGGFGIKKENNCYIKNIVSISYSQPHELFRLNGRMNIEGLSAKGENDAYSVLAIGASHDVVLLEMRQFYLGIGAGIYLRNAITPNLGSKFAFGAKVFTGYQFTHNVGVEIYANHFSNGDLNRPNIGEEYVGASLIYSY